MDVIVSEVVQEILHLKVEIVLKKFEIAIRGRGVESWPPPSEIFKNAIDHSQK